LGGGGGGGGLGFWRLKFPSTVLATGGLSLQFWRLKFPLSLLATGILCYGFGDKSICFSVATGVLSLQFWRLTRYDWRFVTRVLANEVSCYSVGDWRFVASVLVTKVSCYSVGDWNFTPGMLRTLLSGGCRIVVPRSERDRPQLVNVVVMTLRICTYC